MKYGDTKAVNLFKLIRILATGPWTMTC